MNEMAMVEYLLKKYAFSMDVLKDALKTDIAKISLRESTRHNNRADLIEEIIQERFGMKIRETDTEYVAEISVCSVQMAKR